MEQAPIPENEAERMTALHSLGILDTQPEERFDAITREAIDRLHVPISTISIIDSKREWYKSCQGTLAKEGSRDISFCGHAMLAKEIFIVEDTLKDPRFADNPMVVGEPHIRFYAGIALHERESKQPVGVLCIKDRVPRSMSPEEIGILMVLAERAEVLINEGRANPNAQAPANPKEPTKDAPLLSLAFA